MKTMEQKQKDRFVFLKALYEASNGNESKVFKTREMAKSLGFEENYFIPTIYNFLLGEGLIEQRTSSYKAGITHKGVVEVEEALSNKDKPTEHFPAINSITNHYYIEGNSNSNIQIGDNNSASIVVNPMEKEYFEDLRQRLEAVLSMLEALDIFNTELMADFQTLKAQLESSKPKKSILLEVAKSIKTITEGALGGMISNLISGPQLLELLSKIPSS